MKNQNIDAIHILRIKRNILALKTICINALLDIVFGLDLFDLFYVFRLTLQGQTFWHGLPSGHIIWIKGSYQSWTVKTLTLKGHSEEVSRSKIFIHISFPTFLLCKKLWKWAPFQFQLEFDIFILVQSCTFYSVRSPQLVISWNDLHALLIDFVTQVWLGQYHLLISCMGSVHRTGTNSFSIQELCFSDPWLPFI